MKRTRKKKVKWVLYIFIELFIKMIHFISVINKNDSTIHNISVSNELDIQYELLDVEDAKYLKSTYNFFSIQISIIFNS